MIPMNCLFLPKRNKKATQKIVIKHFLNPLAAGFLFFSHSYAALYFSTKEVFEKKNSKHVAVYDVLQACKYSGVIRSYFEKYAHNLIAINLNNTPYHIATFLSDFFAYADDKKLLRNYLRSKIQRLSNEDFVDVITMLDCLQADELLQWTLLYMPINQERVLIKRCSQKIKGKIKPLKRAVTLITPQDYTRGNKIFKKKDSGFFIFYIALISFFYRRV